MNAGTSQISPSNSPGENWFSRWVPRLIPAIPILCSLQYLRAVPPELDTYGTSHFFLTYRHGFQRRAVTGQLLAAYPFLSGRFFIFFELVLFLATVAVTYFVFRKTIFGSPNERILAATLLCAPAMIPQVSLLEGHVDPILYIAMLFACLALLRWPGYLGFGLATTISALAMLQHESYLLLYYPALFLIGLTQVARERSSRSVLLLQAAVLVATFVLLIHFGGLKTTVNQAIQEASARTDIKISEGPFLMLNRRLVDQLHEKVVVFSHPLVVLGFLGSLVLVMPYLVLLRFLVGRTLHHLELGKPEYARLVYPVLLVPLVLSIAGMDLLRWLSASCVDASVLILFWYQLSPIDSPLRRAVVATTARPWFIGIFAYLLAVGPLNITQLHSLDSILRMLQLAK